MQALEDALVKTAKELEEMDDSYSIGEQARVMSEIATAMRNLERVEQEKLETERMRREDGFVTLRGEIE